MELIVLQLWTTAAVFQVCTRGINSIVFQDEMNELLKWYRSLYVPVDNLEYREVILGFIKKQNYYINIIMT